MGYDTDNFNYQVYDLGTRKVIMSHDVTFDENVFPFQNNNVDKDPQDGITHNPDDRSRYNLFNLSDDECDDDEGEVSNHTPPQEKTTESIPEETTAPPRASTPQLGVTPLIEQESVSSEPNVLGTGQRTSLRNRGKGVLYRGMCKMACIEGGDPSFDCLPEAFSTVKISAQDLTPKSLKSALSAYDASSWREACNKEIDSLSKKNVWTMVKRPLNKKVIHGMWLFKRKLKPDGSIKHKARFVALGNTQVAGEDFGETFAPTGKPSSLRLLIAIAATQGWEVHQMDAVTAFLNSDLTDEVYIEQPEGFKDPQHPHEVWKLNKSLYGLKQSPKLWQDDVKAFLLKIKFEQCAIDPCIYIRKKESNENFTAVYVHVDDLAITGNEIDVFKREISSQWEMDDLGVANTVVGIEIKRTSTHQYTICQSKFAEIILSRFNMQNVKPAATPLSPGMKLYKSTDEDMKECEDDHLPYRNTVGSLMYLSQCT